MAKLSALLLACLAPLAVQAEIGKEQQQELRYLVRQDCGSCHGMTLKGGLGPPLTPAALAGKPPELLLNSILLGRPGTAIRCHLARPPLPAS